MILTDLPTEEVFSFLEQRGTTFFRVECDLFAHFKDNTLLFLTFKVHKYLFHLDLEIHLFQENVHICGLLFTVNFFGHIYVKDDEPRLKSWVLQKHLRIMFHFSDLCRLERFSQLSFEHFQLQHPKLLTRFMFCFDVKRLKALFVLVSALDFSLKQYRTEVDLNKSRSCEKRRTFHSMENVYKKGNRPERRVHFLLFPSVRCCMWHNVRSVQNESFANILRFHWRTYFSVNNWSYA